MTSRHALQIHKLFSLCLDLIGSTLEEEEMPMHNFFPHSVGPLNKFSSRGLHEICTIKITFPNIMNFRTLPMTDQSWKQF